MKPSINMGNKTHECSPYDLFNHFDGYGSIMLFQLVLEGKTGKELPE